MNKTLTNRIFLTIGSVSIAEKRKSFPDLLAESALCTCIRDLRDVPYKKQHTLVKRLEAIPPEDYSPVVRKDALGYRTGGPAAPT